MAAPDRPTHSIIDASAPTATDPARHVTQAPASERYTLRDEIARGGMGVIYRASDTVLGREVAVKVLHERYNAESGAALRFLTGSALFAFTVLRH